MTCVTSAGRNGAYVGRQRFAVGGRHAEPASNIAYRALLASTLLLLSLPTPAAVTLPVPLVAERPIVFVQHSDGDTRGWGIASRKLDLHGEIRLGKGVPLTAPFRR